MNSKYKFWFYIGSQNLYGPDVLKEVEKHGKIMVEGFNSDDNIPFEVVFKGVGKTTEQITQFCKNANSDDSCAGVMTWMHTFSPSKMWISGLSILNKPYLHIDTQFNKELPYDSIDMNFMNTNQSAHGDREHGFITSRLRMKRKVICGYWEDVKMRGRMSNWMRSAVGAIFSRDLKVMRLGDNMRYVAVTEGDKIGAERDLGWSVNTYGVGGLVEIVNAVNDAEIDDKVAQYEEKYIIDTDDVKSIRYQARLEIAIDSMIIEGGFSAYTDCFEDLFGLEQLPGLATQNLMDKGIGFGAEGDWKQAALEAVVNEMSIGLDKGWSFMEDYTYQFADGKLSVLGSHMLEISPKIAQGKAKVQVHPLGIGGKDAPARLVFEAKTGPAILLTLVDMGGRFRMIVHDVEAIKPEKAMPNLPVASAMWKAEPDMITANESWILAGGTHHNVMSYDLTAQIIKDYCEIMGVECVHISKDTTIENLRMSLTLGDIIWNK